MAGHRYCDLWLGVTTQCLATYAGLALGGLPVWIKFSGWVGIINNVFPHPPPVTAYHRTLGRELREHSDLCRFTFDEALDLKPRKEVRFLGKRRYLE